MFGFLGLISTVLWVPVVVGLIALGVVLIRRSVSAPGWMLREAACGGCGYALVSTGEGRCPECGGALLKVGVTTPRMAARLRGSGFLLVMGWTLVVVMGGVPVMGVIGWMSMAAQMNQMMGPVVTSSAQQGSMQGSIEQGMRIDERGVPLRSNSEYSIKFDISVTTDELGSAESGVAQFRFGGIDIPHDLLINLDDLSWTLQDTDEYIVLEGEIFDEVASVEVFNEVGLNTNKNKISAEAKYFAELIRDLQQTPEMFPNDYIRPFDNVPLDVSVRTSSWSTTGGGFAGGGFAGPTTTFWDYAGIGVFAVGGVIYLVGLIVLLRKRSRLLTGAVTPA